MSIGYHRPLYLLPFDRRHSYVTGMFDFQPPLTADQHTAVTDSTQVICEGFRQMPGHGVPTTCAAIPVDEEFGAGKASAMQAPDYVRCRTDELVAS